MSFDAHKNFAYSTVATAPSPATSGTSLVVATGDGAKFPATPFNATIWPSGVNPLAANAEIIRVTNISGDTFTITRTQESTSARSVIVGDQIAATITAKTITDIEAGAGGVGNGDESLNTISASGASQTINIANGATQDITLTANCTFTFTSPAGGSAWYMTLLLRQDATGSRTVTWPAITWLGSGLAPILQTAANAVDSVVVFTDNGGSTWFGVAQTSASGLRSGTSFPGSPSDGDLFYRTDRRILYEYNSTVTRWLSLDRKYVPFAPAGALPGNSPTSGAAIGYLPIFEDVYVESWVMTDQVATTNDSTHYWTHNFYKQLNGGSTTLASQDTHLDTHDVWTSHVVSIAAMVTSASAQMFVVDQTKTSTPGNIFSTHMLVLRSAG